jgi:hypothetical protein
MAEIKSTLDLIMERTKGLTMTDEEKRAFKERETAGKIKGLVQKYIDGLIDLDRCQAEVTALKREVKDEATVNRLFGKECLDRIELGKDNERLLGVLETSATVDVPKLRKSTRKFEALLEQQKAIQEKALIAELRKRGISGPSVIPNLDADPKWKEYLGRMKKSFKEEVQSLL